MLRVLKVIGPSLVLLLLVTAWYPYTSGARQLYNLELAGKHLPRLQARLDADPKFRAIRASVSTEMGGCIRLFGHLDSPDDRFRLLRVVAGTYLPVGISWAVLGCQE